MNNMHMRACFAIVSKLALDSHEPKITDDMFWQYIKHFYNVDSRRDISEQQWVQLRSRLNVAQYNEKIVDKLKLKVLEYHKGDIHIEG